MKRAKPQNRTISREVIRRKILIRRQIDVRAFDSRKLREEKKHSEIIMTTGDEQKRVENNKKAKNR